MYYISHFSAYRRETAQVGACCGRDHRRVASLPTVISCGCAGCEDAAHHHEHVSGHFMTNGKGQERHCTLLRSTLAAADRSHPVQRAIQWQDRVGATMERQHWHCAASAWPASHCRLRRHAADRKRQAELRACRKVEGDHAALGEAQHNWLAKRGACLLDALREFLDAERGSPLLSEPANAVKPREAPSRHPVRRLRQHQPQADRAIESMQQRAGQLLRSGAVPVKRDEERQLGGLRSARGCELHVDGWRMYAILVMPDLQFGCATSACGVILHNAYLVIDAVHPLLR